jgi:hypothetical protein
VVVYRLGYKQGIPTGFGDGVEFTGMLQTKNPYGVYTN